MILFREMKTAGAGVKVRRLALLATGLVAVGSASASAQDQPSAEDQQPEPFSYSRIYSDSAGDTHFSDEAVELELVDPGPGIPPTPASAPMRATALRVLCPAAGADAGWHPVPARVLNVILSGRVAIEVSDGETRTYGAGDVILGEDTGGRGHRTTVVGAEPACFAMVLLPDP